MQSFGLNVIISPEPENVAFEVISTRSQAMFIDCKDSSGDKEDSEDSE